MSKSLSLIVHEASKIEQMLIESEGEMTSEIEQFLAVNSAELADKVDSYDMVMERFEAIEGIYKQRAEMFLGIAKRCKATRERLEENIVAAMDALKTKEVVGKDVTFKLVKSKSSVVVTDEAAIPKEYKRTVTTTSVDKTKLGEDLKIGPIVGAKLQDNYYLKPVANKPQIEGKRK